MLESFMLMYFRRVTIAVWDIRPGSGGLYHAKDGSIHLDAPRIVDTMASDWRFVAQSCYHEFWHAITRRFHGPLQGQEWWVEGTATWAEDHVNVEVDNFGDPDKSQFLYFIKEYMYDNYKKSLFDLDYDAAAFWVYFTEQAGKKAGKNKDPV